MAGLLRGTKCPAGVRFEVARVGGMASVNEVDTGTGGRAFSGCGRRG